MSRQEADSIKRHPVVEERMVRIADNGEILQLDYAGAKKFHQGDSWWGLAVGFRAMQVCAKALSKNNLWDRKNLTIVSGHPGPGVRDAIEYVTHCVSRKQFRLYDECATQKNCSSEMKFEWQVSDGQAMVDVKLRDDFIPADFYELLDRLGTENERSQDIDVFKQYKNDLSKALWKESLVTAFSIEIK